MRGNQDNTKANRKDPRYIEIFNRLRDLEYSVGESHWVAEDAIKYLDQCPKCSIEDAISEVFKTPANKGVRK